MNKITKWSRFDKLMKHFFHKIRQSTIAPQTRNI